MFNMELLNSVLIKEWMGNLLWLTKVFGSTFGIIPARNSEHGLCRSQARFSWAIGISPWFLHECAKSLNRSISRHKALYQRYRFRRRTHRSWWSLQSRIYQSLFWVFPCKRCRCMFNALGHFASRLFTPSMRAVAPILHEARWTCLWNCTLLNEALHQNTRCHRRLHKGR